MLKKAISAFGLLTPMLLLTGCGSQIVGVALPSTEQRRFVYVVENADNAQDVFLGALSHSANASPGARQIAHLTRFEGQNGIDGSPEVVNLMTQSPNRQSVVISTVETPINALDFNFYRVGLRTGEFRLLFNEHSLANGAKRSNCPVAAFDAFLLNAPSLGLDPAEIAALDWTADPEAVTAAKDIAYTASGTLVVSYTMPLAIRSSTQLHDSINADIAFEVNAETGARIGCNTRKPPAPPPAALAVTGSGRPVSVNGKAILFAAPTQGALVAAVPTSTTCKPLPKRPLPNPVGLPTLQLTTAVPVVAIKAVGAVERCPGESW